MILIMMQSLYLKVGYNLEGNEVGASFGLAQLKFKQKYSN